MVESLSYSREPELSPRSVRHISLMRHGGPKEKEDTGSITKKGLILTSNRLHEAYHGISLAEDPQDTVLIAHSGIHRSVQTADILESHITHAGGNAIVFEWSDLSEGNVGEYAESLKKIGGEEEHFTEVWFNEGYIGKKDKYSRDLNLDKNGKQALYGVLEFLLSASRDDAFKSRNIIGIGHGPCMVLLLREIERATQIPCLPKGWRNQKVDDIIRFGTTIEFDQKENDKNALYMPVNNDIDPNFPNRVIRLPFSLLENMQATLLSSTDQKKTHSEAMS